MQPPFLAFSLNSAATEDAHDDDDDVVIRSRWLVVSRRAR